MTTRSTSAAEAAHAVVSRDGATIGYLTLGEGPPVLVIPGALAIAADYVPFARALAGRFTVHIIERRGRGRSSPQGDDYSIRKECEDVLAVGRETGAALLVGHSFGGLVALEAARGVPAFTHVAVYEPGVSIGGSIPMGWMPGYRRKLAERKALDAFVEFSRGVGPERARAAPPWLMKLVLPRVLGAQRLRQMLRLLPENLREHQEVARLDGSYENYRAVTAHVLLMYGGKSDSAWVNVAMERLAAVLPHSATREFPKLDHFGIGKQAPREVARAVGAHFLQEHTPR